MPESTPNNLGTKTDVKVTPPAQPSSIVSGGDLVQMVLALAAVLALLKWILPKAVAKFGKRLSTPVDSSIRIEESASFGGGTLQVVSVRDRTLLLAVTGSNVNCLADLTEPRRESLEAPAFFDLVDAAAQQPSETLAAAFIAESESPVDDDSEHDDVPPGRDDVLYRLDRLVG